MDSLKIYNSESSYRINYPEMIPKDLRLISNLFN